MRFDTQAAITARHCHLSLPSFRLPQGHFGKLWRSVLELPFPCCAPVPQRADRRVSAQRARDGPTIGAAAGSGGKGLGRTPGCPGIQPPRVVHRSSRRPQATIGDKTRLADLPVSLSAAEWLIAGGRLSTRFRKRCQARQHAPSPRAKGRASRQGDPAIAAVGCANGSRPRLTD
jgi:hypothetical protein